MTKTIVTDEDVEKALDFMRHHAIKAAKAKAERVYLEEGRKAEKARLMKQVEAEANKPMSIAQQERDAYAHPEYQKVLEGLRAAVEEDERCRFSILAAQALLDAWRTQQANQRAMEKAP